MHWGEAGLTADIAVLTVFGGNSLIFVCATVFLISVFSHSLRMGWELSTDSLLSHSIWWLFLRTWRGNKQTKSKANELPEKSAKPTPKNFFRPLSNFFYINILLSYVRRLVNLSLKEWVETGRDEIIMKAVDHDCNKSNLWFSLQTFFYETDVVVWFFFFQFLNSRNKGYNNWLTSSKSGLSTLRNSEFSLHMIVAVLLMLWSKASSPKASPSAISPTTCYEDNFNHN